MAYRQASPFVDQFFDTNGLPLSGGTIKSYLAGTTTATSMYTDSSGTSAGSSITLNVRGEPEVSGNTINIWLDEGVTYKFVLADSSGTSIWTDDGINVGFASGSLDIQGTNPLINFKTGASESYDTRIAQIANGLAFYTGGNAQTVLGMLLDQNRNLLLDPAGAGGAPAAPLHVKGATADYPIKVESTDSTAGVQLSDNATTGVVGIAAVGDNAILKGSKVGIGTDSPSHTFDVYANADNQYVAQFSQDHATGWGVLIDTDGTSNDDPALWVKNASDTILWAAQSGNVGIGTSSPDTKLDVNGNSTFNKTYSYASDNYHIHLKSSYGNGISSYISNIASGNSLTLSTGGYYYGASLYQLTDGATGTGIINIGEDGTLTYQSTTGQTANSLVNPSERMRIDSSGNVLVGTANANNVSDGIRLKPDGFISAAKTSAPVMYANRLSTDGSIISLQKDGSTVGSISVTGSATAYNTSSDYRLKEDIKPINNATQRLLQLKPCNFKWKSNGTRVDGFIAHEAQEVVSDAVTGTKDAMRNEEYIITPAKGEIYTPATEDTPEKVISKNVEQTETLDGKLWRETKPEVKGEREVPHYQGIDQAKLVPLLVKTVQELEARIKVLEAK